VAPLAWRALARAFSRKVRVRLLGFGHAELALRHRLELERLQERR
jgi:hypothetical protein